MRSFVAATIAKIVSCFEGLKRNEFLQDLKYAFLVGEFSPNPLIHDAARGVLAGNGCAVVVAVRPNVAIVRGGVLFATAPRRSQRARCSPLLRRRLDRLLRPR